MNGFGLRADILRRLAVLPLVVGLLLTADLSGAWAQGAGDLVVTPTRVVLEGRERAAQVKLANRGSAAATFRISLIAMHMDDNGQVTEIEPGEHGVQVAGDMIRYAPRQITIAPGATQVVRLSVRKPSDLADGEYRSHMFFRAVPDESAGRSVADDDNLQDNELRIQLIPIYGITIPVIVRHGDLAATAGVQDVAVLPEDDDGPARVVANLTREGTQSVFGDLIATYTPASGGSPTVVAQITRVAVYTPNDSRRVVMPLRLPDGVTMGQGTLDVTYRAVAEDGGGTLASTSIALN